MAENKEEPMEVTANETAPVANHTQPKTPEVQSSTAESETPKVGVVENEGTKASPLKTDESGKKVYTEEERLKRKAYFKQLREKRRLAREKNSPKYIKFNQRFGKNPRIDIPKEAISFKMSEEETKMLEFYKVRLSTLKLENEQLHKRLAYLVRENLRLLQMGPPLKTT